MSEQTKTWNKYIHKVQNYETDQMGIVHHSNYIRWFEEARCDLLDYMGVGFADLEKQGIISPILSVEADYLRMVYYGDTVSIDAYIKEYNGIKPLDMKLRTIEQEWFIVVEQASIVS